MGLQATAASAEARPAPQSAPDLVKRRDPRVLAESARPPFAEPAKPPLSEPATRPQESATPRSAEVRAEPANPPADLAMREAPSRASAPPPARPLDEAHDPARSAEGWGALVASIVAVLALLGVAAYLFLGPGSASGGGGSAPPDGRAGASVGPTPAPTGQTREQAQQNLLRWMSVNLPVGGRILAPPALIEALQSELSGRSITSYDASTGTDVGFVVTAGGTEGARTGPAAGLVRDGLPLATFGRGAFAVTQLRASTEPSVAADAQARRDAGRQLAENPELTVGADELGALRAGQVDARVLTLLTGLLTAHSVRASFPVDPEAAVNAPLRTLQIEELDGSPVPRGSAEAGTVTAFLDAQQGLLKPGRSGVGATVDGKAFAVRYPLPVPLGLLDNAAIPTISPTPGAT